MGAPRIYLAGLSGAGKSTVAERLAGWLGWALFDVDTEIEHEAGCSVAEIWAAEGEPGFRRREAAAVERLVCQPGPAVAALGGGTLEDATSRERLAAWGTGVYLEAEPGTLAARVEGGPPRPLLAEDPAAVMASLAAARAARYEALPCRVDATADAETVAVAVARYGRWPIPEEVAPGVLVGEGALGYAGVVLGAIAAADAGALVVATAEPVWARHGAILETSLGEHGWRTIPVTLPDGEASKSEASLSILWRALAENGADRDTPMAVLGGGAPGDVGGLAAATFKRGVPLVLFPTTLLAQVDAAIGGKNAIDLDGLKNVVGTFHLPERVVVDPLCLLTLSERDYRSGWAEVVKAGLIADPELFDLCADRADDLLARRLDVVAEAVGRAIRVKADIVAADLREAGPRRVLNLGHTLGHAFESVGAGRWTHGEAVSMGIVAAARFGEGRGVTEPGLADRITATLSALGLPTAPGDSDAFDPPYDLEPTRLAAAVRHDKKRGAGALHAVLPVRAGEVRIEPLDDAEVGAWIDAAGVTR